MRNYCTKDFTLVKMNGYADRNYDAKFALNEKCIEDIQWWVKNVETSKKHVYIGNPTVVITSDASLSGWGGVYENNSTGGRWSVCESSYHINQLELLAVY